MTVTISRLYDDPYAAHRAVNDLEAAGIPSRDISLVASNADEWYDGSSKMSRKVDRDADGTDDRAEGAGVGAGIGAALGGAAGASCRTWPHGHPGLGSGRSGRLARRPAAGAVAGGATGGIIGALTQSGVSKTDAEVYAEGVRRGGTLVTARVPDGERARTEAILDQAAINIREREQTWRDAGWTGFDHSAKPYSADQVRTEREMYRERTMR